MNDNHALYGLLCEREGLLVPALPARVSTAGARLAKDGSLWALVSEQGTQLARHVATALHAHYGAHALLDALLLAIVWGGTARVRADDTDDNDDTDDR